MMTSSTAKALLLLLLLGGALPPAARAQSADSLYVLSADSLQDEARAEVLPFEWKYHPGDNPAYARPGFDASAWPTVDTRMPADEPLPPDWTGIGWFRLRLRVDSALAGRALGMRLFQTGASEVYLNGELLFSVGEVGGTAATTVPRQQHRYHILTLPERDTLLLAVRYANHRAEAFHERGYLAGFGIVVGAPNYHVAQDLENVRTISAFQFIFVGVFGAFALLHLALFAFYPQAKENLYFALLIANLAGFAFWGHQYRFIVDPWFNAFFRPTLVLSLLLLIPVLGLVFAYRVFELRRPWFFYLFLAVGVAAIASAWLVLPAARWVLIAVVVFFLVGCAEMLRVTGLALYRSKPGARILGIGIAGLVLTMAYAALMQIGLLPQFSPYAVEIWFVGALALVATMSVYLSRRVARTSRDLRKQLEEVKALSEEKVEQERRRERMQVAYERKLEELEEARRLQLSMLPDKMPEHPELELAAHMETATEVGGDYYDFTVAEDGTLTLAVGDATGHGLKAGTMVTATKSLFNALGAEDDLLGIFDRSTKALKQMNLRRLYMALTLAKFSDGTLRLAAAGMPPALHYCARTGEVEPIRLKGMPLGSLPEFPYREECLPFGPGDAVLFMSDGFPERFNAEGEMMGYEAACGIFAEVASRPPQVVIDHFVEAGRGWADGAAPDDDVTFVAVKHRAGYAGQEKHIGPPDRENDRPTTTDDPQV